MSQPQVLKVGGRPVSIDALKLCRDGVRNVLSYLGVLKSSAPVAKAVPKLYELTASAHVISEDDGVFEPIHKLGTEVKAGQLAGRVHFLSHPGRKPVDMHYRADGIVYGKRQPGRVRPGNCCLVVATPHCGTE